MAPRSAEEVQRIREKNQKKRIRKHRNATQQLANTNSSMPTIGDLTLDQDSNIVKTNKTKSNISAKDPQTSSWDIFNDVVDYDPVADEIRVQVESANRGWPWVDCPEKLVSQAPFSVNEYNYPKFFTLPRIEQSSALFQTPRDLEHPILRILCERHFWLANFAATCQDAYFLVNNYVDHWDVTRSDFLGCDMDPERASAKDGPSFAVGKIVIVSQFRNRQFKGEDYPCQIYALQHLTMSFNHYADRFETLHLHRVPLLTTHVLALVVPYMRRLRNLGIFRCELIHFADTGRLLDIVDSKHRGAGQTQHINLDFYPRFHEGPDRDTCDVRFYGGTYGVTWDNARFDTRLGIVKMLMDILPRAKEQGIDLVSKNAAFRHWLEKSPLWRLEEIIQVIDDNAGSLNDPNDLGTDLNVAAIGAWPHTKGTQKGLQKLGTWAITTFACAMCDKQALGVWFDWDQHMDYDYYQPQPPQTVTVRHRVPDPSAPNGVTTQTQIHTYYGAIYNMTCIGCRLHQHLDQEPDHWKLEKHRLSNSWMTTKTPIIPFEPSSNSTAVNTANANIAISSNNNRQNSTTDTPEYKREIETEDLNRVCYLPRRERAIKLAYKMQNQREKIWKSAGISERDYCGQKVFDDRQQGRKAYGWGGHAPTTDMVEPAGDGFW